MKQSQWVLAAVLLAGGVFLATFAMNYLGGTRPIIDAPVLEAEHELLFAMQAAALEREAQTPGFIDFWFYNPHDQPVRVGLNRKSCQCAGVDVFLLPDERRDGLARDAAALVGLSSVGQVVPGALLSAALLVLPTHAVQFRRLQDGLTGQELMNKEEQATVGPGRVGWVRLSWSPRKVGQQTLHAELWFDNPVTGKSATLSMALLFQNPLRANPIHQIRPLRDDDLEKGYTEYLDCWSSSRPSFRLEASTPSLRGSPSADPFVVGRPIPMTRRQLHQLAEANNENSKTMSPETRGSVLSGYRIPITLQAVSADGKVPFDVGPFQREVILRSPDLPGDPVTVTVRGRVRAVVEVANEDGEGINFHVFPRDRGKVQTVALESHDPRLELEFDRDRTPAFLAAAPPERVREGGGRAWTLRVRVLPGKADGDFPRPRDPLYEDSAVYLIARLPGKPPRSIRIPVRGSAR